MTELEFSSDLNVSLIDVMGGDLSIVRAARVSTLTDMQQFVRLSFRSSLRI